jgi:hypothetical protein
MGKAGLDNNKKEIKGMHFEISNSNVQAHPDGNAIASFRHLA